MFKLVLSEVELLTNSIPIISEIIDEGIFKVDKTGISMISPDRTMVSVVDFKILSSAFDEFKVDKEHELGINLSHLSAVLKRVRSSDKLILESGDKNRFKIKIEGTGLRTFEIPLIEVNAEKPPVDQLNFSGSIEMDAAVFGEGIADAEVVGDSAIISASPESFKMLSKGDVSFTEMELKKSDKPMHQIKVEKEIKAQYPLDYLKKMIKASKLSKNLLLEFGNDYPMRMTFKNIDKVIVTFILAPRVSEE